MWCSVGWWAGCETSDLVGVVWIDRCCGGGCCRVWVVGGCLRFVGVCECAFSLGFSLGIAGTGDFWLLFLRGGLRSL